ncbi:triose-phosphate isomerase [Alteromonas sp. CYL-A6]|uniref:triose-phosphate isomerase n=1 Tax=Alteromonas nitratireducens TaxID=3390813 RepID=UPI0034AF115A
MGNWKMNGSVALVEEFNQTFVQAKSVSADVVICPPSVYLTQVNVQGAAKGAQNISEHVSGAYTGELSGQMIKEAGCRYVIVGHSERREMYGETNELVAKKAKSALTAGLTPVICVGESLDVRENGDVEAFIGKQLAAVTNELDEDVLVHCVIAYEPVWAIGTGKTATGQQAQDVHAFIRQTLAAVSEDVAQKVRILYGGSVKPDNAQGLFSQPDIDGGLIGGASLNVKDFTAICQAAN